MATPVVESTSTPNLPTNIVDFRGFERGGILMSIGDFPETFSQAMLVGIMLVGRLGVVESTSRLHGANPSKCDFLDILLTCIRDLNPEFMQI